MPPVSIERFQNLWGLSMLVYDIQNLVKTYPGQTLPANAGITLQIHPGEIFGLLWDNGAGKSTLVRQMANLLAFFLLSLPSLLVTLLAGVAILKLELTSHPLVLVVVPLATICMAGLGALIGASARTPEEADSISLLCTFIMLGLGPVLIPPDRLPSFMVVLGYLSPATYAASAFRQVLLGPVTARILVDLVILAVICLSTLWLVERKMTWRQSQA